ncbi:hypothetical protein C8Q70DRAFT_1057245 [Cubamyces menziesii]|nr:hypothetical protein C8Q70DRAFT_1057245 [Cubamyces menziesii]
MAVFLRFILRAMSTATSFDALAQGDSEDGLQVRAFEDGEMDGDEESFVMCDRDPRLDLRGEIRDNLQTIMHDWLREKPANPDANDPTLRTHWVGTSSWMTKAEKAAYTATFGNEPSLKYTCWSELYAIEVERIIERKGHGLGFAHKR